MINSQEQYEAAKQRVKQYRENMHLAETSNDMLLLNPVIRNGYKMGMQKLIKDLISQIHFYEDEFEISDAPVTELVDVSDLGSDG